DQRHALVVSYGAAITAALTGLLGLRHLRERPLGRLHNTATTCVVLSEAAVELRGFNDATHLDALSPVATLAVRERHTVVALMSADAPGLDAAHPGYPVWYSEAGAASRARGWIEARGWEMSPVDVEHDTLAWLGTRHPGELVGYLAEG